MIKTFYSMNTNEEYEMMKADGANAYIVAVYNPSKKEVTLNLEHCDKDLLPHWLKNWVAEIDEEYVENKA